MEKVNFVRELMDVGVRIYDFSGQYFENESFVVRKFLEFGISKYIIKVVDFYVYLEDDESLE